VLRCGGSEQLLYETVFTTLAVVMMVTQLELAEQVSSEGIKLLAQICAFVAGVATAFGLLVTSDRSPRSKRWPARTKPSV
jgi:hypothetical protein